MAEFVFADLVDKKGLRGHIATASRATSTEEVGNDIHMGTRQMLTQHKIPFNKRKAKQITIAECQEYDYLICMDEHNLRYINSMGDFSPKLLLDFAKLSRDIADPWYTGNFEHTYDDIVAGCEGLLYEIIASGEIAK